MDTTTLPAPVPGSNQALSPGAAGASPDRGLGRIEILFFLSLPWLLLLVNPRWMDNPVGTIDPWIYHGYFRNLTLYLTKFFPGTYYGTRLPWILPGAVCYKLLPPVWANWIFHASFFYLIVFSFRSILRATTDRRTAFLVTLLAALHCFTLNAIAWDYVTGGAMAYCLLALALLTVVPGGRLIWMRCVGAGAAFFAAICCHLTLLVFTPVFLAYFLIHSVASGLPLSPRPLVCRAATCLGCMILGGALLQVALGLVNLGIEGHFWFLAPQIRAAVAISKQTRWKDASYSWLLWGDWLVTHAVVFIGCGLFLLTRRRTGGDRRGAVLDLALPALFIVLVLMFVALELQGQFLLQYSYYSCYLIPFTFLVLSRLVRVPERLGRWAYAAITLLAACAAAAFLRGYYPFRFVSLAHDAPWMPTLVACLIGLSAGVVGLAMKCWWPRTRWSFVAALLLLSVTALTLGPLGPYERQPGHQGRVEKVFQTIQKNTHGRKPLFWYAFSGPMGLEYRASASIYLWSYSLLNEKFPTLEPASAAKLAEHQLVALLTPDEEGVELANESGRPFGFRFHLVAKRHIVGGYQNYWIFLLETHRDLEPVPAGAGSQLQAMRIRPSRWIPSYPPDAMRWEVHGGRIEARSVASQWGYIATYPEFEAPRDGLYVFRMRYKLKRGGIAFGALSSDQRKWIVQAPAAVDEGDTLVKTCQVKLKRGEKICLVITNDNPAGSDPSELTVEKVDVMTPQTPSTHSRK